LVRLTIKDEDSKLYEVNFKGLFLSPPPQSMIRIMDLAWLKKPLLTIWLSWTDKGVNSKINL
jgi:hypothetical protein